jgi:hypothetical protein
VLSVTEGEAQERAELLTDIGYDVFLDLAATPASSQTRVRFRCRRPGADTFAQLDLAAASEVLLNGQSLPPPDGGRVRLPGLAAENVLVAGGTIADVGGMDPGLIRFTDPADGADYVLADGFPDQAARLFCCFDQPSLPCEVTLTVRVPPGWHPLGNGRAQDGGDGVWRFGTVTGMRPNLFTVCAGPYHQVWAGGGPGVSPEVALTGCLCCSMSRRMMLSGARPRVRRSRTGTRNADTGTFGGYSPRRCTWSCSSLNSRRSARKSPPAFRMASWQHRMVSASGTPRRHFGTKAR